MPQSTPTVRIDIQIGTNLYQTIKHAADIQGISTADFAVDAIRRAALRTIDTTEVLTLSNVDQNCLADALLNPPEPNNALKRAFAHHNQHCLPLKPDTS